MQKRQYTDRPVTPAQTGEGRAALAAADVLAKEFVGALFDGARSVVGVSSLGASLRGRTRQSISATLDHAIGGLDRLIAAQNSDFGAMAMNGEGVPVSGDEVVDTIFFNAGFDTASVKLTWHEDDVVTFERGGGNNYERTVHMWRPEGNLDLATTVARVAALFFEKAQRKGYLTDIAMPELSDEDFGQLLHEDRRSESGLGYYERGDGALIL